MASAANVHARKAARIQASAHRLTLVFPPVYAPTTVTPVPGAAPASPLTGVRPANTLVPPAAPTRIADPLTVPCLWYDTPASPTLGMSPDARAFTQLGWRDGAHALAEVLVADVALDPSAPYAATQFDSVEHVEHGNRTYRVLEVRPFGAGMAQPVSYLVWLGSATNQPVA